MNQINKIYICHYSPLKERHTHMIEQCKKYNLEEKLDFITEHDREKISKENLQLFNINKLKLCEISLFLKHIQSMKEILKDKNPYGIIMEDDVIFKENFVNNFDKIMKIIPNKFDILYTGFFPFLNEYINKTGIEHPTKTSLNKVGEFYCMNNISVFPWTGNNKGTDFYIISKEGCAKFLVFIEQCKKNNIQIELPIDHCMGQFFYKKGNVYWTNNEITLHGSNCKYVTNGIFANSMAEQRGH